MPIPPRSSFMIKDRAFSLIATVLAIILAVGLLLMAPSRAPAETEERIVANINGNIISRYDVEQRVLLTTASTEVPQNESAKNYLRRRILQELINEQLQLQEAQEVNITVDAKEVRQGLERMAKQNDMDVEEMLEFLKKKGVLKKTVQAKAIVDISWEKFVKRRLAPFVDVGNKELDTIVDRLKARNAQPWYSLQEIFLPVEKGANPAEVARVATQLSEDILAKKITFDDAVLQYSETASLKNKGHLGWTGGDQLQKSLLAVVKTMKKGEVKGPIKVKNGFYLIKLVDINLTTSARSDDNILTVQKVHFIVEDLENQMESERRANEALTFAETLDGCSYIASQLGPFDNTKVLPQETLPVKSLSKLDKEVFNDLSIGEAFPLKKTDTAIQVIVLCDILNADGKAIAKDGVENNLFYQRLTRVADSYLRDARRNSLIEIY